MSKVIEIKEHVSTNVSTESTDVFMIHSLTRRRLKDPCECLPSGVPTQTEMSHFRCSISHLFVIPNYYILVIEVYQAWCGPCKAVMNLFRKLRTDFNDDNVLYFAAVRT